MKQEGRQERALSFHCSYWVIGCYVQIKIILSVFIKATDTLSSKLTSSKKLSLTPCPGTFLLIHIHAS